jgi:hypothetical protein
MSFKTKVIALSASLALLLLLYAGGIIFSPERSTARVESGRLLAGTTAEVASLSLGAAPGEATLEFRKDSSSWALLDSGQELPALDSRIEGFLSDLAAVKRLSPRSSGKEGLAAFGLDAGKGSHVVARAAGGKVLADFTLGGYGPTGKDVYVKLGSKDAVYSVDAGFSSWLREGRGSWLNLRVFAQPIKPEDVESLSMDAKLLLDGSGKPPTLASWSAARKDGSWTGSKIAVEPILVESVIRSILNLEGQDIAAKPPADAFSPVLGRIALNLGSGAKVLIEVGKDAGGDRLFLRTQASPYVYLVSLYSLKNVFRPAEAITKK